MDDTDCRWYFSCKLLYSNVYQAERQLNDDACPLWRCSSVLKLAYVVVSGESRDPAHPYQRPASIATRKTEPHEQDLADMMQQLK